MKVPSILVVDDEPDNFDVIDTLLTGQGYELHYSANGYDAIASLETFWPDVILLDVMMPEVNGLEVCRRIKSLPTWQMVPIIMVTALSSKEDLARCLEAGADDFISKPVNSLELRARVRSMLRIKQQYDSIQSFSKLQKYTIQILQNSLQELRGNLASSLSHELNTPLSGVLGSLEMLIADVDEMSSEERLELLDLAHRSAQRLEGLTHRFVIYLYVELENEPPANHETVFTNSLIEYLAQSHAKQVERLQDLTLDVADVEVNVSPQHFQWIIDEVVDNAFKFSAPGSLVQIEGKQENQWFHLWVRDRGRGMTHEQIMRVGAFMQFERSTYEQQGIGLGLKIAKKTTELYGGRFIISSTYQQETAIHITLPIVQETEA
jgi:DNA-binding response OmpR family regulator